MSIIFPVYVESNDVAYNTDYLIGQPITPRLYNHILTWILDIEQVRLARNDPNWNNETYAVLEEYFSQVERGLR